MILYSKQCRQWCEDFRKRRIRENEGNMGITNSKSKGYHSKKATRALREESVNEMVCEVKEKWKQNRL